jgi:K+-transporting ATPase A subunit
MENSLYALVLVVPSLLLSASQGVTVFVYLHRGYWCNMESSLGALGDFPVDLIFEIVSFLSPSDIIRFELISKGLKIYNSPSITV